MEPEVAYLMQVFIDKVRPMVTDDQSPNSTIFVKADGQPFRDGRIGRRITFFVVKSGVCPDTMISVTDFRKWIVTTMYKKKQKGKKIDEEPLCRLMCHSDYTAKKWNLRDSLTDQAAEAAEQIKSFSKPSPKKRAPECDDQEDQAEFSPSKRPLSEEEHQAVKEVFQPEIEKHSPMRKKVVMAKMREHPILMKALTSP